MSSENAQVSESVVECGQVPVIKDELAILDKLDREADREFQSEIRRERRRTKNPAKRVTYRDSEGLFCVEENAVSEEEREAQRESDLGYYEDGWKPVDENDGVECEPSAQGNPFRRGPWSLTAWLETVTPEHRAYLEAVWRTKPRNSYSTRRA